MSSKSGSAYNFKPRASYMPRGSSRVAASEVELVSAVSDENVNITKKIEKPKRAICKKEKYDARYLTTSNSGTIKIEPQPQDDSFPKKGEFMRNGKRYLRVVTQEYVRDLVIPEKEETARSLILCKSELDKILTTKNLEGRNKDEELRKQQKQYEKNAAESDLRKRELNKHITSYREMGPTLQKLEYVAKLKANLLLQKAKAVRQEDEDDIKLCNKLLLGTKCQAIRDAQMMERKQIKKELEDEEKHLNDLMEQERLKKLAREKEELLLQKKKKEEFINDLNNQVKRNLLEREMEAEKQFEEAMILNESVLQIRIDQLRQEEKKKIEKEKVKSEINKMNEQILNRLEEEKEKAKLADLKIQELMKKKADEEKQREENLKMEQKAKEMEIAKLGNDQKTRADKIDARETERVKRVQAQYEAEWINKERREYEKKQKANEKLKKERLLQIEEKQRIQAQELEKEQEEIARLQLMEETMRNKEQEQKEERRRAKEEYKSQLLKQMNEKEKERIAHRKSLFEDGIVETMDMKLHKQSLKDNMQRKVKEIRTHNIPEKYIFNVEKKLRSKTSSGYD